MGQIRDVRLSFCHSLCPERLLQTTFLFLLSQVQEFKRCFYMILRCYSGRSVTGRIWSDASGSVCLVDIVDGQLEGCGREGLRHGVASVTSVCRGRHRRILLQSGQSCRVGGVVCDGDVSSSVQAACCWDTLDVVGHGIDGSDWTTLGKQEGIQ